MVSRLQQTGSGGAKPAQLKRSLNLVLLTLYGVGVTVGAGIYVLVGSTAGRAGIYAPVSFLIASVVVGFTAFTYAELSTRFPVSAGEAVYVRQGFGSTHLALLVGLMVIGSGIVSSAAIAIGAAGYIQQFVAIPQNVLVVVVVALLGLVAFWGIVESVAIAAVFTVIEVGGLVFAIYHGVEIEPQLLAKLPNLIPPLEVATWSGIGAASLLAFFAFVGFEDMANVAEEVKDPRRTLPVGIILTLFITATVYFAVTLVVVLVVPLDELANSPAPLSLLFRHSAWAGKVFSAIAVFATINGILVQIIMASRVLYGLSQQVRLLAIFGQVNAVTHTPVVATLAIVTAISVLALFFPIAKLARSTSMIVLMVFVLANAALLHIKRRRSDGAEEHFSVPIWVPAMGLLSSLALLTMWFL
jgi:amino acid transporter